MVMNKRREFVKSLSLMAWSTPVIHSVILPAHAQTSGNLPPLTQTQPLTPNEGCFVPNPADTFQRALIQVRNNSSSNLSIASITVNEGQILLPNSFPVTLSSGQDLIPLARSLVLRCSDSETYRPVFTISVQGFNPISFSPL